MKTARAIPEQSYFEIRLTAIAPNTPLAYDVYLLINKIPVLYRCRGEVMNPERLRLLILQGRRQLWIPKDQKSVYLESLRSSLHNLDLDAHTRGLLLKETAYLQAQDLFTKNDRVPVIQEARELVHEMVSFVTTDSETLTSLMHLSAHDHYTYNHCVDVAVYSIILARKVFGENKTILLLAGLGGLLHDIGKRKITGQLLNKRGSLSLPEWEELKRHPVYGKEYLSEFSSVPNEVRLIVVEHHENFDGTGYPEGLKGDEISRLARLISIADVFDALTTDRSYHRALDGKDALGIMFGMQPGKFDPDIFRAFNKNFSRKTGIELDENFDPCSANPFFRKIRKKQE